MFGGVSVPQIKIFHLEGVREFLSLATKGASRRNDTDPLFQFAAVFVLACFLAQEVMFRFSHCCVWKKSEQSMSKQGDFSSFAFTCDWMLNTFAGKSCDVSDVLVLSLPS